MINDKFSNLVKQLNEQVNIIMEQHQQKANLADYQTNNKLIKFQLGIAFLKILSHLYGHSKENILG